MKDPAEEKLLIESPKWWEYLVYNNKIQIILVLILCAFIGIGTPFIWQQIWKIEENSCTIESDLRYNCFPQRPTLIQNKTECLLAKCCWDDYATDDQIKCYYGIVARNGHKMPGYKVQNSDNKTAILINPIIPTYFNITNNQTSEGAVISERLAFDVKHYTPSYFSVKIGPEHSDPSEEKFNHTKYLGYNPKPENNLGESLAEILWKHHENDDFSLSIRRKRTNTLIFNTGDYSPFIFGTNFIEITTLLPNDLIYGLGQSPSKSFKHNMTYPAEWSILNKQYLNLTLNQSSWFGSHPFYMGLENDGNAYGVLLINTFPIEIITNSRPSLTFRVIGGELDFHFFMGPTPAEVIKQLMELIGKPSMPPYWSLGFHLCRTTCELDTAKDVMTKMLEHSVPFESDCGSSALTSVLFNPTSDSLNFDEFLNNSDTKKLVVQVPQKMKYDPKKDILDKDNGIALRWDSFALRNQTNNTEKYSGYFFDWCGEVSGVVNKTVIFPNFFDDRTQEQIINDLKLFEKSGKIDGLVLNYNTPLDLSYSRMGSNYLGNKTCQSNLKSNEWDLFHYSELNENTPCLDLVIPDTQQRHMAFHNLYGFQHMKQSKLSLETLNSDSKRKLVMSLSTFIGSGRHGGHIGVGMNASWEMLRQTMIQTLEFNMYGIPLNGFPVCGYKGQLKEEELCLRWYQLSAFQPFMISYRDFNQELSDPISVSKEESMALEAIKSAITIRYRLLPYLYTLFYKSHTEGETVLRPLFFEFPEDRKTYRIDKQYFWGSALMISPVTEMAVKSVKAYFPKGNWYDFYSGKRVAVRDGGHIDLSAIEYHINLHIRGGYVVPTQQSLNNTDESREMPFTIISALNANKTAKGELFIDDGYSEDTITRNNYLLTKFYITSHNISIEFKNDTNYPNTNRPQPKPEYKINTKIDEIKVFGITDPPLDSAFDLRYGDQYHRLNTSSGNLRFDQTFGVLTFRGLENYLDLSINQNYFLNWTYKQWD